MERTICYCPVCGKINDIHDWPVHMRDQYTTDLCYRCFEETLSDTTQDIESEEVEDEVDEYADDVYDDDLNQPAREPDSRDDY